jgi:hypothetical protein
VTWGEIGKKKRLKFRHYIALSCGQRVRSNKLVIIIKFLSNPFLDSEVTTLHEEPGKVCEEEKAGQRKSEENEWIWEKKKIERVNEFKYKERESGEVIS